MQADELLQTRDLFVYILQALVNGKLQVENRR